MLKYWPTCSKEALNVILALIADENWKLNAIDIKTSILQGKEADGKVFVMPPKEAEKNVYLLKKKCVHSLGDASPNWYNRMKSFLISIGLKMSKGDASIFYYDNDDMLQGLTSTFVDDFLRSGTNDFETNYISKLRKNSVIGKEIILFFNI